MTGRLKKLGRSRAWLRIRTIISLIIWVVLIWAAHQS